MPSAPLIKATHKSITAYYATLQSLAQQNVSHEMGLRRAFQELLAETAKLHDWTLVTEDAFQTPAASPGQGATVRPDATLRDKNTLPRGLGESKGHRLDVLLPQFDQAKDCGTKTLEVKIYMPID